MVQRVEIYHLMLCKDGSDKFLQLAFNNLYVNKQPTMFNNIFLDGNYSIKWWFCFDF